MPDQTSQQKFTALLEPLRADLLACATQMCASSGWRDDPGDVLQDALVRMWSAFDRFEGPDENARGWAFTILTRVFLSAYNKRRRRERIRRERRAEVVEATVPSAEPVAAGSWYADASHPASQLGEVRGGSVAVVQPALELDSAAEAIAEALGQIRPEYAEVFRRACVRGETYSQVARELGMPAGSVMSALHRGRGQLRERLRRTAIRAGIRVAE